MSTGESDGEGGRGLRPELFVKGWVANGSKESRRCERVIGATLVNDPILLIKAIQLSHAKEKNSQENGTFLRIRKPTYPKRWIGRATASNRSPRPTLLSFLTGL